ncbi:unnamed protein product, partial [Coregonus sp. 'balchen']
MSGHRVVSSADTNFYSATKYAVTALTEGLRQELREAKNPHSSHVFISWYGGNRICFPASQTPSREGCCYLRQFE